MLQLSLLSLVMIARLVEPTDNVLGIYPATSYPIKPRLERRPDTNKPDNSFAMFLLSKFHERRKISEHTSFRASVWTISETKHISNISQTFYRSVSLKITGFGKRSVRHSLYETNAKEWCDRNLSKKSGVNKFWKCLSNHSLSYQFSQLKQKSGTLLLCSGSTQPRSW